MSSNILTNAITHGGTWVLLNTLTASGSATLSDTTSFTSKYAEYEIVFSNVVAATTSNQLELQVHSGGAFQTTAYQSNSLHSGNAATSVTNPTTFIPLTSNGVIGNTAAQAISGFIRVANVSSAGITKNWIGLCSGANAGSTIANVDVNGGFWTGTGAIDGFQILMGSGNITSCTVKIYGRV